MKNKGVSLIIIIVAILAIIALIGGIIFVVSQNSSKQGENISETKDSNNPPNRTNTSVSKSLNSYSIGDKVTLKVDGVDEVFFVIKDSPESEDIVTLITKENIDTKTLKQSATADNVKFWDSDERKGYWWDDINKKILNKYNTNDGLNVDIPADSSKIALYTAQEYGTKIGGIGRLLLKSEADTLKGTNPALLYANDSVYKATNGSLNYWLGSAYEKFGNYVWNVVTVKYPAISSNFVYNSLGCGVRPVVEISKSKI